MTIGELRELLAELPDHMRVLIQIPGDYEHYVKELKIICETAIVLVSYKGL